jgi:hypothetical protein
LHNPDDEPVANFNFTFDFEHEELGRERIQELTWEEIRTYHPEINPSYPSSALKRKVKSELKPDSKPTIDAHFEEEKLRGSLKRTMPVGIDERKSSEDK